MQAGLTGLGNMLLPMVLQEFSLLVNITLYPIHKEEGRFKPKSAIYIKELLLVSPTEVAI